MTVTFFGGASPPGDETDRASVVNAVRRSCYQQANEAGQIISDRRPGSLHDGPFEVVRTTGSDFFPTEIQADVSATSGSNDPAGTDVYEFSESRDCSLLR